MLVGLLARPQGKVQQPSSTMQGDWQTLPPSHHAWALHHLKLAPARTWAPLSDRAGARCHHALCTALSILSCCSGRLELNGMGALSPGNAHTAKGEIFLMAPALGLQARWISQEYRVAEAWTAAILYPPPDVHATGCTRHLVEEPWLPLAS